MWVWTNNADYPVKVRSFLWTISNPWSRFNVLVVYARPLVCSFTTVNQIRWIYWVGLIVLIGRLNAFMKILIEHHWFFALNTCFGIKREFKVLFTSYAYFLLIYKRSCDGANSIWGARLHLNDRFLNLLDS